MAPPKKSHCKRGHPRTPDNVSNEGECLTCRREHNRARNSRRRQELEYRNSQNAYLRQWRQDNPDYLRKQHLRRAYDLTIEDIPDTCQVCGSDNGSRTIFVDHSHETGNVRGFLCHSCNTILGHAKDDPALLEKLALYLRSSMND